MILFYDKTKNNKIFNIINGRVHPADVIEKVWVQPGDLTREQVGKYIVPFRNIYKTVLEPVYELRVVDQATGKVEQVHVGDQQVEQSAGMEPDVSFKDIILEFEEGKKDPFDYRIVLSGDEVVDIVAIQVENT